MSIAKLALFAPTCFALLQVINPPELVGEIGSMGIIESSLSNFGHITYGQTLVGRVIRPRAENAFGCSPLTLADFPDSLQAPITVHPGPYRLPLFPL